MGSRSWVIAYNGYDTGLGNRVRLTLSALALADLEERAFAYVWPTGRRFGPHLDDLWHVDRGTVLPRALSRAMARRYPYVDEDAPSWLTDDVRRRAVWQVRTARPVTRLPGMSAWEDMLRALQPVDHVRRTVERVREDSLGEPYVGVMIRAHANQHPKTKATSPVEWFMERMRAIADARPGTRFFLSCDVPEVQAAVTRAIPGVVAQEDKGPFNSTTGVRDAVADLYLLAGAGHLVAPYFTSFVNMAVHLSGDVLRPENPLQPGPAPHELDLARAGWAPDPVHPHRRVAATAPAASPRLVPEHAAGDRAVP